MDDKKNNDDKNKSFYEQIKVNIFKDIKYELNNEYVMWHKKIRDMRIELDNLENQHPRDNNYINEMKIQYYKEYINYYRYLGDFNTIKDIYTIAEYIHSLFNKE
jgi:hypothetical protein